MSESSRRPWYGRCTLAAANPAWALGMVRSLFYVGLEALGAPRVVRRLRCAGTILCYHNVLPAEEIVEGAAPDLHIPLGRFEAQVRWLARHYEIVPLGELVERIACGRQLRRASAVTFDDGYAGVFEHALPLLASLGIPATVFVIADAPGRSEALWWDHPDLTPPRATTERRAFVEALRGDEYAIRHAMGLRRRSPASQSVRPANWHAIAAAAHRGIDIGVHSATHRSLPQLTDQELQREVVVSRRVVHTETGITPEFFAYPYGLWDERVRSVVRDAGYRAAVTLDPGLNPTRTDQWALRRINVPASISPPAFRAWTAGLNPRWVLS